jgi:hypothetical protein
MTRGLIARIGGIGPVTRSMAVLGTLALAAFPAAAQSLTRIPPETLVRVTPLVGPRVIGPLAEIRADSIFLASTVRQSYQPIALGSIRQLAYQDGVETHTLRGALIGAGIGLAIAFLGGRGDTDDFRVFSLPRVRNVMMLTGAFIGGARAPQSPRWVVALDRGEGTTGVVPDR